jgi:hypothetical protein
MKGAIYIKRKSIPYEECHKIIDGKTYKLCNTCGEWLPMSLEFYYKNDKSKQDGLFPYCRQCTLEKTYIRQAKNVSEYMKERRKYAFYQYHNNIKVNERAKLKGNKRRESGYSVTWRKENKDKVKKYGDKYKKKAHQITKEEWESCLNYFNNSCAYCGITLEDHKKKFNQQLHKEHISDCGRNDLKNCIPSCKSCNSQKHTSSFNDWYNPENPKYTRERYSKICKWIKEDCKLYIEKKSLKIA